MNDYVIFIMDGHKYHCYRAKNKVIAVSTYGGKFVKGVAKCSDEDNFDWDTGIKLAALRCNAKIAAKRADNARKRAIESAAIAHRAVNLAERYINEAMASNQAAETALDDLMNYEHTLYM